jgi:flagellar basal body-associated protein FliL
MADEQPRPPSGAGLGEAIRNYAVLVILVLAVQIALAFFIIRTLIIGRREDPGKAALLALEELKPEEQEEVAPDKPARVYDIKEDLLTNSADGDRLRYVKVHVQIGVTPDKVYDEIGQIEPKVVDTILGILTSRTVEEMDDPADKEVIKDEIKIALNKFIRQGEVVKVYLTAFLIQ